MYTETFLNINQPQNLVMIYGYAKNPFFRLQINDDYVGVDLYIGSKLIKDSRLTETDGFVSILTLQDYQKFITQEVDVNDPDFFDITTMILLPNFVGDIKAGVLYEDDQIGAKQWLKNIDFTDYIEHQVPDGFGESVIQLPDNTKMVILDQNFYLPQHFTAIKINQLMKI